jgi:hypothetical protein
MVSIGQNDMTVVATKAVSIVHQRAASQWHFRLAFRDEVMSRSVP